MSYLFGHREDLFNNNWDLIQLLIDGVKGEEFSNYNGYKLIKYDGKFYVVKGKKLVGVFASEVDALAGINRTPSPSNGLSM